jgi:hypothetical protein
MNDMGLGILFGWIGGIACAAFLILIAAPTPKEDCDSFGMTRLGGQVYVCSPKGK